MSNHDLDCSCLILLDETLGLYYKQLGDPTYNNGDGIGILWQYIIDEQLEDDEIEKELGYGCIIKDCTYVWIWDNILFPIPNYVKIDNDQRDAFIFYVLQHCYKHGTPPTDKEIKYIVINKIGGSIFQITKKQSSRKFAESEQKQEFRPNNSNKQTTKRTKQKGVTARFTVGRDARAYEPKSKIQSSVRIPRELTKTILSKVSMAELIQDLYQQKRKEDELEYIYKYMVTILNVLSLNPIKNNDVWILCFGFHDKKTGEPLYCIANRLSDDAQRYKWEIRDTLFPAAKISHLTQLSMDKLCTTWSFTNTSEYKSQIRNIQFMNEILSDPNKFAQIFSTKQQYKFTDVSIFKNHTKINKFQLKLGIPTQDFLKRCIKATNGVNCIKLMPFLFFNRKSNGFCIDGLLMIRIDENIDIGITFKYNKIKQIIMPSGIHIDLEYMERQCKLANPQQSTSIHKYFANFTTPINDLSIRGNNYLENKCKELEQKNKILTRMIKQQNKKLLNICYASIYCVTKTAEICCFYNHQSQHKPSSLNIDAVEFVMPGNDKKTKQNKIDIMETISEQR